MDRRAPDHPRICEHNLLPGGLRRSTGSFLAALWQVLLSALPAFQPAEAAAPNSADGSLLLSREFIEVRVARRWSWLPFFAVAPSSITRAHMRPPTRPQRIEKQYSIGTGATSAAVGSAPPLPEAPRPFARKHINVVDPLLPSNNLGRSVSQANFMRIRKALGLGHRTLTAMLKSVRVTSHFSSADRFLAPPTLDAPHLPPPERFR